MNSFHHSEDFPVDNLVEALSNFIESCEKNEDQSSDSSLRSDKNKEEHLPSATYNIFNNSLTYSSHSKKNKRKSAVPVKNAKRKNESGWNNDKNVLNIKTNSKLKISENESEREEDSPLIIDENRRKRRQTSMIQTGDIPEDVLNVIVKSGIDDQLESVAMKEKLTNTIVKNIIKQVVTNKSVLAMIKKDIYGIDFPHSDFDTFEPKLTRAKTKELIERQIIDQCEEVANCGSSPSCAITGLALNSSSVMPDTCSLVNFEFSEDEDDEEYRPELDDMAGSDEESTASSYGSPSCNSVNFMFSRPSSSICTTPSRDSLGLTPSSSLKKNVKNHHKQLAQRSLKFNLDESLICSRTRSKCPLTDTPLEHLEMAFQPPDITADMYETTIDNEDYRKFLLDFLKPPDSVKQVEDDERIDPEYNLMADTEEETPSFDELKEEFRGDRGVRISKREVSELVTDSLSSLESEDEDQEEDVINTCNKEESIQSNTLLDVVLKEDVLDNSTQLTSKNSSILSNSSQENQELCLSELANVEEFKLTKDHLEIVEYQLAQHTQLLLQSTLMCCYEDKFKFIEDGCNEMLNELANVHKKKIDEKTIEIYNIYESLNTIKQYNEKREAYRLYRIKKENKKLENCGTRYFERNYAPSFPPILQKILAESCAFPFVNLLPKGVFSTSKTPSRKGFFHSEYCLLGMTFKEIVPDVKIFLPENRNKKAKYFDSNLSHICNSVAEKTKVITTGTFLSDHFCRLLKQNLYKGLHEDNPLIKYTKNGVIELPKLDLDQKDALYKVNLQPLKYTQLQKLPPYFQKIISKLNVHSGKQCFSGVLNGKKVIVKRESKSTPKTK